LESIDALVEESKMEINTQFGGNSEDGSMSSESTDFFNDNELREATAMAFAELESTPLNTTPLAALLDTSVPTPTVIQNGVFVSSSIEKDGSGAENTKITSASAERRKERKLADEERDAALLLASTFRENVVREFELVYLFIIYTIGALLILLISDSPPEASGYRRKRTKLSTEDELIKNKHEHDMKVEKAKLELDKEKHRDAVLIENKKLELEELREKRLAEESRRRDELALGHLEVQKNLMTMLAKLNK